jgi:hypothetical protein
MDMMIMQQQTSITIVSNSLANRWIWSCIGVNVYVDLQVRRPVYQINHHVSRR